MPKDSINPGRRTFLKTAAAAGSSLLIPGPLKARTSKSTLKIGYLPITDATPLLVAHSLGYFSQEGLTVEKPIMVRSWSILTESFLAGKFNMTHMLFPIPVWMRFNQNIPVKVLAWNHINGSAITVRGDSDIHRFSDLAGKQIAVPSWNSMHNLLLQMGLTAAGLKPVIKSQSARLAEDEVNLFILPPPDMPAALLGKKVDGFIVADPFNALSQIKFRARVLRFTGDIWKNHPCCVIVSHQQFINANADMIQRAINAVVKAQLWCNNNPHEAAHLLSRDGEGYLPVPYEVVKKVFTVPKPSSLRHPDWNVKRIGFQPYPFESATRFIIDQMGKTMMEGDTQFLKELDTANAAKDLIDDRFVKIAIDRVGGLNVFITHTTDPSFTRKEIVEIN
ncbi:MAG: ABC transporter substrate-binding protein [Desulfobacteraceae bacterium]|nr:MAG: ABC transporter substrate-binding protein [Desulfobacteraceae bacterium]